jgi:hypothetical protein
MGVLRYCCWAKRTVTAFLYSVFSVELIPQLFQLREEQTPEQVVARAFG